jgi:hypothetical protein
MSAMIFAESLPMWHLSLLGQQSPTAPYWRSCSTEEMKTAITDVSHAASQTLKLKQIHWEAIASRWNMNLTCAQWPRTLQLIVISGRMRIVEWLRWLRAFGAPKSASEAKELKITSLSMVRNFSCHGVKWSAPRLSMPLNCIQIPTSSLHQDRQGRYCDAEESQRLCTAHTSGAQFFKQRSPYIL